MFDAVIKRVKGPEASMDEKMQYSCRTFNSILEHSNRYIESCAELLGDLSRIINFTRGLLEFDCRSDDIFIVTYPRSGTTLAQFLLYLLTHEASDDFEHISQVVPWFERSLAVGALTASDLDAMPSPRLFKSHLAYCWLPKGAQYIYITREGSDVVSSYYHFYRSHLRFGGSFEQFFERFIKGDLQYKSWFKHTTGWHAHRNDPRILFLRFEDLVNNIVSCIEEITGFCHLKVPEERIVETISKCRFDYMKQHENRFDFTTELVLQKGYTQGAFLRRGKTGEGKELLSREQKATLARTAAKRYRHPDLELDLRQFLR